MRHYRSTGMRIHWLTTLFASLFSAVLLLAGVSVAAAALTFSGTNITGDAGVVIDGSSTISIGTSSATGILIGGANAATTFLGNVAVLSVGTSGRMSIGTSTTSGYLYIVSASSTPVLSVTATGTVAIGFPSGPTGTGIYIGYGSDANGITGTDANTALGYYAMNAGTTAYNNTAVGVQAMQNITTGHDNVAIGDNAMQLIRAGNSQVAVGNAALQSCSGSGCQSNDAFGDGALESSAQSNDNTAVGDGAMTYAQGIAYDTAVGEHSEYQNVGGMYDTSIGAASLYTEINGTANIGIGRFADFQVPPDGFTLSLTSGTNLGVGSYVYKVAFILNGTSTNLSLNITNTITTTANNQAVVLSNLPIYNGPLNCTGRVIYRTKVGGAAGSGAFYLVATIADNVTTSYTDNTPDSSLTTLAQDPSGSIIIGATDNAVDHTAYKGGQLVIGTHSYPITEFWIGQGVYSSGTAPSDVLFSPSGGDGANVAGANLIISGGPSTGNVAGGSIIFKTTPAGNSGTTWNNTVEAMRIAANGNVGIGTSTPATSLQVAGASSTIRIGASSLPGCLEMGNSDGSPGINYVTVLNGVISATTTKPSNCE